MNFYPKARINTLHIVSLKKNQCSPAEFSSNNKKRKLQRKHSKNKVWRCAYFSSTNNSPGFNFLRLPSTCQGFIFEDKITFQQILHIHASYYIHDKCIQLTLYLFRKDQSTGKDHHLLRSFPRYRPNTLQIWLPFCHSFRSQLQFQIHSRHGSHFATHTDLKLQIQSRYAPDTVAILSVIHILVTVSDTL